MPHAEGSARRKLAACCLAVCCLVSPLFAEPQDERRSPIVKALERVRSCIVNIHGEKTLPATDKLNSESRRVNGMGTGVIIDRRGYILTNFHVVDGVKKIEVTTADGDNFFAEHVARDPETDLAVIRVTTSEELPVLEIGSSDDLMVGETVVAVGNPFGYGHTATRGIISALHRSVQVSESQCYEDLIQTDASINPGNSGGPLLNANGDMIGINVAVRAGAQGIGFAIPADKVVSVAARLMGTKRLNGAWHGITCDCMASHKGGVLLSEPEVGSPAEKCGIEKDDVLLSINSRDVRRSLDIELALLDRTAGDEIKLAIERKGEPLEVSFVMEEASADEMSLEEEVWETIGLKLDPVPNDEFQTFKSRYHGGMRVRSVRSGGPAAKQGIRTGDVLVGMHTWETVTLDHLGYILSRSRDKDLESLKFYILRNSKTLWGHLTVAYRKK